MKNPNGMVSAFINANRWFALPPCWGTKQKKICSHSWHKKGIQLPEEKTFIVPVHQHGRHNVTCKSSIGLETCTLIIWLNFLVG